MSNIYWFQPLKCKNFSFFVIDDSNWRVFGLELLVGQKKLFEKTLSLEKLWLAFSPVFYRLNPKALNGENERENNQ